MFDQIKKLFGLSKPQAARRTEPEPRQEVHAPFEFVVVPGNETAGKLEELRKRGGTMPVVPVVLGGRPEFDNVVELIELNEGSYEDILRRGLQVDVEDWLKQRLEDDPDHYRTEEKDADEAAPADPLTVTRDVLTGEFKKEVFIGLIPVSESWQVPAYLKTGGWNDCPEAEIQVAFFRRWFDRYGAVVTSIAGDVIEFRVQDPPRTQDEAHKLAMEQFIYCSDIVHQGLGTVNNLAASLLKSHNWYFWWD